MNALFEYRNSLDNLRFTPEEKAALAERAAESAGEKKHRHPLWRTALIAACLAAALAVGAGASGVLKSAVEVFAPIFGGSAAQTEGIDKIGHPIGAGDTDNGVTITADAIIGDAYNAAIVYTIRRDDGTALLPEGTDPRSLLMGGFGGASLDIRGGTAYSPVFTYANTQRVDLVVYFTDGKGEEKLQTPPKGYKVLWVLSGKGDKLSLKKPFGLVKRLTKLPEYDPSLDFDDVEKGGFSMNHQEDINMP